LGDSGQNDPNVYVEAARQHRGQVAAIVILDVGEHMADRAAELRAWQTDLASEGVPFLFVADATDAAHHLAERGLIESTAVRRVATQQSEQESM
jgi:phosphatidate phosphatase APP1